MICGDLCWKQGTSAETAAIHRASKEWVGHSWAFQWSPTAILINLLRCYGHSWEDDEQCPQGCCRAGTQAGGSRRHSRPWKIGRENRSDARTKGSDAKNFFPPDFFSCWGTLTRCHDPTPNNEPATSSCSSLPRLITSNAWLRIAETAACRHRLQAMFLPGFELLYMRWCDTWYLMEFCSHRPQAPFGWPCFKMFQLYHLAILKLQAGSSQCDNSKL